MQPPASPEPSPGARDEAGPTEIGEHGAVASSSEEDEWSAAVADTEQPDPTRDGEGCSSVVASALIASPQKKPRRGRPPAKGGLVLRPPASVAVPAPPAATVRGSSSLLAQAFRATSVASHPDGSWQVPTGTLARLRRGQRMGEPHPLA